MRSAATDIQAGRKRLERLRICHAFFAAAAGFGAVIALNTASQHSEHQVVTEYLEGTDVGVDSKTPPSELPQDQSFVHV